MAKSGSFQKTHSKRLSNQSAVCGKTPEPRSTTVSDPGLLDRTSYTNASVALKHMEKGRATGNHAGLWVRSKIQEEMFQLGSIIQVHAGKVLFTGLLLLSSLTIGLKSVKVEDRIDRLWVVEGGRVAREMEYMDSTLGEGAGGVNQMLIQTGEGSNLLSADSLLHHLKILKRASRVTVQKDDITWQLADLCYKPSIPQTELQFVEQILDKLFPCAIITPLDCFWEGSKLLGPDSPVYVPLGGDEGSMGVSWPTLHPTQLFDKMAEIFPTFRLDQFQRFMKDAGINSGYQEKPCLNPLDPGCPLSAPNKNKTSAPDIGAELTGGCSSFATRYMRWPEELVVGGAQKNKSGYIREIGALQSVVQLMGPRDMLDYWSNTYKVHTLRWNLETAQEILQEFQERFQEEVEKELEKEKYEFNSYSSLALKNLMNKFSTGSITNIVAGYIIMVVYAGVTLYRWGEKVRSHAGLGVCGVLLVSVTIAAGMGLAGLTGLVFNASSTQIVPFLALGLGVDSLFLLIHTFSSQTAINIPCKDQVGEVLRKCGVSVLATTFCNVAAFLAATIIPIPAMRSFCFQAAILISLNLFSVIILLPAMIALDVRRVFANKYDILCCVGVAEEEENNEKNESKCRKGENYTSWSGGSPGEISSTRDLMESEVAKTGSKSCPKNLTLARFARDYYGELIIQTPIKIIIIIIALALLSASAWGINKLEDGLNLTDVVPKNTPVWKFLEAEDKYFGFYNMYAITEGNFEYPENQQVIYDFHNSFVRVQNIIKDDNGGLPEFWLSLFRSWLIRLQEAYDKDTAVGLIDEEGWKKNASDDGILAYKLLVQTGHVDFPVDKSLLRTERLVIDGMINPSGFYNYLSAWYSNDAMAYSFSQGSIVPTPKSWFSDRSDYNLKIPKSKPIRYAQIPFLLKNLGTTDTVVETILQVREICDKFEVNGLPNFPNGIPFTFWEQYIGLRSYILIALGASLVAVFLVVSLVLMSPWAAALMTFVIGCIVGELFGALGILGIKLSAVPAIIIILSVGLGVEFTIHFLVAFVGSVGNRERRTVIALEQMFAPVIHGAVSTLLGVLMLAFSQFDFIVRYFFLVLLALVILGLFNGLAFFPVLLVILGPPAQIIPTSGDGSSLPPLTPPTPTARFKAKPVKPTKFEQRSQKVPRRHNSDLSLSTIAEESHSQHSTNSCSSNSSGGCGDPGSVQSSLNGTSVFLEPHITVETSTLPQSSTNSSGSGGQVTKVTATAKFKLELHTPAAESSSRSNSRSRSRRSSSGSSTPAESLRASGDASTASSLSSDGGFSER